MSLVPVVELDCLPRHTATTGLVGIRCASRCALFSPVCTTLHNSPLFPPWNPTCPRRVGCCSPANHSQARSQTATPHMAPLSHVPTIRSLDGGGGRVISKECCGARYCSGVVRLDSPTIGMGRLRQLGTEGGAYLLACPLQSRAREVEKKGTPEPAGAVMVMMWHALIFTHLAAHICTCRW